jgi:hypothetical protein
VTPVKDLTQNPKTDTEEIRGKLGQKSGRGDEDDAQEGAQRKSRSWRYCGRWKRERE